MEREWPTGVGSQKRWMEREWPTGVGSQKRILAGTTRAALLRLAGGAGMAVECRPLGLATLGVADEVFLTSSVAGVLPAASLVPAEGFVPGDRLAQFEWPAPGLRTSALASLLWKRWQTGLGVMKSS
ncbi:MAG: aminotransferase class IV [Acidimicrobiales bacterium]